MLYCNVLPVLKLADVTPLHYKKKSMFKNLTIDQLVFYLTFQIFLKGAYIDKFQNSLKLYFRNFVERTQSVCYYNVTYTV